MSSAGERPDSSRVSDIRDESVQRRSKTSRASTPPGNRGAGDVRILDGQVAETPIPKTTSDRCGMSCGGSVGSGPKVLAGRSSTLAYMKIY